jgi:secondary thiamine-phosphate synthase enzyme
MTKGTFCVSTKATMELVDITQQINQILQQQPAASGLLFLFNPHTTAGLTINEGADPAVRGDIIRGFQHLVPQLNYRHLEGNSVAHIMATLAGSSLTVAIDNNQMVLGTWQRIFFCEFDGPRQRTVRWQVAPAK